MENFEKRRDRFNFFEGFENPLLNLTMKIEVENFVPRCKEKGIPPFHFFLYCVCQGLQKVENFRYRTLNGEIIKIDRIKPSYTVLGEENLFNYTRFEMSDQLDDFVSKSLIAKNEAEGSQRLINTGNELPVEELKKFVFITSLPWLDFTSIQHPVYKFKSADIPSIAWGKFNFEANKITMPFSIQAHHGFVDGYHMNLLVQEIMTQVQKNLNY